jgi:hypothetical protein
MKDWSKIFKSYKDSDIYTIQQDDNIDQIEKVAITNGFTVFKVDLSGILTKQGFLRSAAKAMQFPSYFGQNWDAFEECLTDFEWCTAMGYVLIFRAVESFTHIAPDEIKMARNIFKSAVKYWKKQKKPFYVLLVDK